MNRACAIARSAWLGVMLTMSVSCHATHRQVRGVSEPASNELTVTLTPGSPVYELDAAAAGAVRFFADVQNPRARSVVVAHPTVCVPAGRDAFRVEDRHGRSEILLEVTRPDGSRVTLRDGPHFFEPGRTSHLRIPPGGSQRFTVGWFFLNARGRWENDAAAATLFSQPGQYTVRIVLRNMFRCAIGPDDWTPVEVWTGEMRSDPVTIRIGTQPSRQVSRVARHRRD